MEKIDSQNQNHDRLKLLNSFVDVLKHKLGSDLISVVLFGSAAENRLRIHSDVNLMIILNSTSLSTLEKINNDYRDQHSLINLNCMFLEKSELTAACNAFPLKFLDISKRSQVLFGENVIPLLMIDKENLKFQLKQTMLNLTLRLRERYTLVSLRKEQLINVLTEFSGPLRGCAFSLAEINGEHVKNPKEALNTFLERNFPNDAILLAKMISTIRETSEISESEIAPAFKAFFDILIKMQGEISK